MCTSGPSRNSKLESWSATYTALIVTYLLGPEGLFVVLIDFEGVLYKDFGVVAWNLSTLNNYLEVEGFAQQVSWLTVHLLVQFFRQVPCPCLVCRQHVNLKLSALDVLPNNRNTVRVVNQIDQTLERSVSIADGCGFFGIPEGVLVLWQDRYVSGLVVLL